MRWERNRYLLTWIVICFSFVGLLLNTSKVFASKISTPPAMIAVAKLHDVIMPASLHYFEKALKKAEEAHASLFILQLNTQGGLVSTTRIFVQQILNSPIPIVVYVSPAGAHAASAGTFLLYAAPIAAMAPGTNVGAATPIHLSDISYNSQKYPSELTKTQNDILAHIKALAQLNGRNVAWAEDAVLQAKSISADEALQKGVINYKASSIEDLLQQLNGRKIQFHDKVITLTTIPFQIVEILPGWIYHWLSIITQPNIAYLLMIFGFYGIVFEFFNPGFIAPGVLGIVSLLIAGYAFSILPITETGILLIILSFVFFIGEMFVTSGALIIAGIISLVVGSLLLFDTEVGLSISLKIIISVAITTLIFFTALLYLIFKARNAKQVTGDIQLLSAEGIALEDFQKNHGWILIEGERWYAVSDETILKNDKVQVTKRVELELWVKKLGN